jgi:hypothetical protein
MCYFKRCGFIINDQTNLHSNIGIIPQNKAITLNHENTVFDVDIIPVLQSAIPITQNRFIIVLDDALDHDIDVSLKNHPHIS